jgi:CheY-like chemotaxis protein
MKYSKILIVDDSVTSRLIVKRCFEMAGFADAAFMECEDGAAAMELLQDAPVDLVVTDLRMPNVDGVALIRSIRAAEHLGTMPVVVISSVAQASEQEPELENNVVAVIQKPLSPAKVMHALREE